MINLRAYAKINLGLRVLGKRADGYHDIETIFHRIDVYDELSFAESDTVSLESDSPELSSWEENLCIRAARLLSSHSGAKGGVHISLRKKIPLGAGLGGGSSDAAATLLGLNEMWRLGMKYEELHPIAAQLGSDVPYFIRERSAYATGRGEILEYFPLQLPFWIVVIFPNIRVSTAWAYEQLEIEKADRAHNFRAKLIADLYGNLYNRTKLQEAVGNDFEPIVFHSHPELGRIKHKFYEYGAHLALMSGSGSSMYGLFESKDGAEAVVKELERQGKIFITRPGFSL